MPNDRQLSLHISLNANHRIAHLNAGRVFASEAEKVKYKRINNLVRERVLLFQQRSDENVGGAPAFTALGDLLSSDITQALESCSRVKNRDRDASQNRRNNVCFSQSAAATADQREEKALEKGGRLIETFLERVEKVDVELLVIINILANPLQDNHFQESLYDVWLV